MLRRRTGTPIQNKPHNASLHGRVKSICSVTEHRSRLSIIASNIPTECYFKNIGKCDFGNRIVSFFVGQTFGSQISETADERNILNLICLKRRLSCKPGRFCWQDRRRHLVNKEDIGSTAVGFFEIVALATAFTLCSF